MILTGRDPSKPHIRKVPNQAYYVCTEYRHRVTGHGPWGAGLTPSGAYYVHVQLTAARSTKR